MARPDLAQRIGFRHPIVLAPMAGLPTADLAAEVSEAGGLGLLGAAYLTPDQLREALRRLRARTARPFGVNLFTGGYDPGAHGDAGPILSLLAEVHRRLELPPPTVPSLPPDPFPAQLEIVLEERPALFTSTFGVPPPEAVARLHQRGVLVAGTATTVREAERLAGAGVDAIVAQGAEAGGHRGTFEGPFEEALIPTVELTRAIVARLDLPVVASGGLMDGRDVAAVLAQGAEAAQLGTAFLACPESGASAPYLGALRAARADTTVLTRAFSGRLARGLANEFTERLRGREEAILPYPLQNALTRPMRTAAAQRGEAGFLSLWAGQGVARLRALPARELMATLVAELARARA